MLDTERMLNEVTTGEPLEKGGYFVAYNYVMRNAMKIFDLTMGEYSCLTMLFSYAGADKDKCFPSQAKLAECLNVKDRAVRKYLDGLEKKRCLVIYNTYNNHNQKTKNVYDLSPCLHKIREIFCANEVTNEIADGVKMVKKSRNIGQVQMNLSNSTDRSERTGGTGPNEPTTSNNIQITNNNIKDIDDDKANSVRPIYTEEELHTIIESLREEMKNDLSKRSYDSVVKKVKDKYKQGKINISFRDYLVSSLISKIEELERRRAKDKSKEELSATAKNKKPTAYTGKVPIYNWLEEDK